MKLLATAPQAGGHGAKRDLEQRGDLGRRHSFHLDENENGSSIVGEAFEHFVELGARSLPLEHLLRPRRSAHRSADRRGVELLARARPLASHVGRDLHGYAEQKGALAVRQDVLQAPVRDPEDLLHGVVDLACWDAHPANAPPEKEVVGVDEGTQATGRGARFLPRTKRHVTKLHGLCSHLDERFTSR